MVCVFFSFVGHLKTCVWGFRIRIRIRIGFSPKSLNPADNNQKIYSIVLFYLFRISSPHHSLSNRKKKFLEWEIESEKKPRFLSTGSDRCLTQISFRTKMGNRWYMKYQFCSICTQRYIITQITIDEPGQLSSQPMPSLWGEQKLFVNPI